MHFALVSTCCVGTSAMYSLHSWLLCHISGQAHCCKGLEHPGAALWCLFHWEWSPCHHKQQVSNFLSCFAHVYVMKVLPCCCCCCFFNSWHPQIIATQSEGGNKCGAWIVAVTSICSTHTRVQIIADNCLCCTTHFHSWQQDWEAAYYWQHLTVVTVLFICTLSSHIVAAASDQRSTYVHL